MQDLGHAATAKQELQLKRLRRLIGHRPLTEARIAEDLGIPSRTAHNYLKALLERGDAAVVRSESRAQDTPRYVAAFRGIPVMEGEIRRSFSGYSTSVSDAD